MKLFFLLLLFLLPLHITLAQNLAQDDVAIVIGDHTITKAQIFEEMAQKYPKEVQDTIQGMIVYWIIRQECSLEKIVVPAEIIQQKAKQELQEFQQQIQQQTRQPWPDYLKQQGIQEKRLIQKLLLKWKYQLSMEQLIRLSELRQTKILARHILTDTQSKAQDALQKLKQGQNFIDVVQQDSLSNTRSRYGELPWLFPGDFEPSVDAVLFKLQPQEMSGVIQSSWGYHIFQVLEIQPGNPNATWQNSKEEIALSLIKQPVSERDLQRWLQKVSSRYPIKKNFQFSIGEYSNP